MIKCLIVAAGGAIGAVGRYLIGLMPMNPENGFPIKTFLIKRDRMFYYRKHSSTG